MKKHNTQLLTLTRQFILIFRNLIHKSTMGKKWITHTDRSRKEHKENENRVASGSTAQKTDIPWPHHLTQHTWPAHSKTLPQDEKKERCDPHQPSQRVNNKTVPLR